MSPQPRRFLTGKRTSVVGLALAAAAVGLAVVAGITLARTFTLQVAKHAAVTNQTMKTIHENIVVNSKARAVYELSGETKSHPECTSLNGCFLFWPPVKVASRSSLSKAPGVPGKLGIWHRNGFNQVTLSGHPLYTYSADRTSDHATGQGVNSFGGTWFVVKAKKPAATSPGTGPGIGTPSWG